MKQRKNTNGSLSLDLKRFEIAALVTLLLLLVSPLFTSAQTVDELQAQIQALLARVAALQGQMKSAPISTTPPLQPDDYGTGVTAPNYCPQLSTTMQRGARDVTTGGQVSELQTFLTDYYNLDENIVVGGYFGKLTAQYLIKFQNEQGLPAFGIAGSLTRAKIAQVCGGVTPPTPVTPTQVQAQDMTVGTGKEAISGSTVSVRYTGKLQDGTIFDSSSAHGDQPLVFVLGAEGLIPGFQIGVNGMKEGGERIVTIPPSFGYGAEAVKDASGKIIIPANSTLVFNITLITVTGGQTSASITTSPSSGSLSNGTLWVDTVVSNYKPQGNELVDFGDGSRYALGYTTPLNNRHDYHTPGTYTVRLLSGSGGTLATATVTVSGQSTPAITVISPNGGAYYTRGNPISVWWKTANIPSDNQVLIRLRSVATGQEYNLITTSNDGNESVNPSAISVGSYTLEIKTAVNGQSYVDASDSYFKIVDPTPSAGITVTAPNGGESIAATDATQVKIAWRMDGISTPLSIALYKNDQWLLWIEKDLRLDKSPDGTYSYTWVPNAKGPLLPPLSSGSNSGFKIYITGQKADGTGYLDDKSDAPFSFMSQLATSTAVIKNFISIGATTWTVPVGVTFIEYLVVGGGGGGGKNGGGGGGGAVLSGTLAVLPGTELSVLVGAGGEGSTTRSANGKNGGDSQFASVIALGGGGGGSGVSAGSNGGSGGGGGGDGSQAGGSGATGGNKGGHSGLNSSAGGGGGAAHVGGAGIGDGLAGGAGGDGAPSSIAGTIQYFGGGGGGGSDSVAGLGGLGGGGAGSIGNTNATAGGVNTGGGGGGGRDYGGHGGSGADGGSGIVILKFSVLSGSVASSPANNLANALTALESAIKALIAKLGQ